MAAMKAPDHATFRSTPLSDFGAISIGIYLSRSADFDKDRAYIREHLALLSSEKPVKQI